MALAGKAGIIVDHTITDRFIVQWQTDAFIRQPNAAHIHLHRLTTVEGHSLAIIDIGAEKIFIAPATVTNGTILQTAEGQITYIKNGNILATMAQIITSLQKTSQIRQIAISSHGLIKNHRYVDHTTPALAAELKEAGFENDIGGFLQDQSGLQMQPTMYNDAVSGGAFAFGAIAKEFTSQKHLVYVIVGGGVGGCYIDPEGNISAAEPGHVAWIAYPDDPQAQPCPQAGPKFCGEVYAKGPYIETALANKYLSKEIPGPQLDQLLEAGNNEARMVYQHAARNIGNILLGLFVGFSIMDEETLKDTIVITHGGVPDNVDLYNTFAQEYVMNYLREKFDTLPVIPFIQSKKLLAGKGQNAGALGAGLLAF